MLKKNNLNILKFKYPDMLNEFNIHSPIPYLKSEIINYQNKYLDYIQWIRNINTRISIGCSVCKENNLKCPCQLQKYPIINYIYKKNKGVLYNFHKSYIYVESNRLFRLKQILKYNPKYFCINDTEPDLNKRKLIQRSLNYFFDIYYPDIPYFENNSNSSINIDLNNIGTIISNFDK